MRQGKKVELKQDENDMSRHAHGETYFSIQ